MKGYADLYALTEDQRIDVIGKAAETSIVDVGLESQKPDKIARYIKKVIERFPLVKHYDTKPLHALVSIVRFGPIGN